MSEPALNSKALWVSQSLTALYCDSYSYIPNLILSTLPFLILLRSEQPALCVLYNICELSADIHYYHWPLLCPGELGAFPQQSTPLPVSLNRV